VRVLKLPAIDSQGIGLPPRRPLAGTF
jgi:hypothetical protein